jgi:hypothetical protein
MQINAQKILVLKPEEESYLKGLDLIWRIILKLTSKTLDVMV